MTLHYETVPDWKTRQRHILLTGYCSYRDVYSVLVYQWREDFVGEDFICMRLWME